VTNNRQGCFPHCEMQKTSLCWPRSVSTGIDDYLFRLFSHNDVHPNDEWHADQTRWTPGTTLELRPMTDGFQKGLRKTTKPVIPVGVRVEIRCQHVPDWRQKRHCSTCLTQLHPLYARLQGYAIVQWFLTTQIHGICSICLRYQQSHWVVTSPCTQRQ
jgi:hypothetical protein